uniref:COG2740: Predicted nucleic-acid-binding protein implicated in transcription termination n=1 Tax=Loigolactobacillus rennini TaxID=238013 RepID=A0A1K2I6I3_9LACO|nr:COG2740: Predicted nucleic-acid-binding protein implicated in transcription termination [Loigolactobacillus rennini]
MKQKKIPMRKDVVSNEMKPKKEMVRIVRDKAGQVAIDPTGKKSGRGAYVSLEPDAVELAFRKHILDQALNVTVAADFYQELLAYVKHQKARKELFGDKNGK